MDALKEARKLQRRRLARLGAGVAAPARRAALVPQLARLADVVGRPAGMPSHRVAAC